MLAIAISVLFALTALAAIAVIHASLVAGTRRARAILAELAEIDREARVIRLQVVPSRPRPVLRDRPCDARAPT